MSYIPSRDGYHTGSRTLQLVCRVCDNTGWMQAARVDGSKVGDFTPMPCWVCAPTRLKVMTL